MEVAKKKKEKKKASFYFVLARPSNPGHIRVRRRRPNGGGGGQKQRVLRVEKLDRVFSVVFYMISWIFVSAKQKKVIFNSSHMNKVITFVLVWNFWAFSRRVVSFYFQDGFLKQNFSLMFLFSFLFSFFVLFFVSYIRVRFLYTASFSFLWQPCAPPSSAADNFVFTLFSFSPLYGLLRVVVVTNYTSSIIALNESNHRLRKRDLFYPLV